MTQYLKYWRDLTKQKKSDLMAKYQIKVMTYEQIKMIYEKEHLI